MSVTLQRLFKISFFIYSCSYDATIAELLVPNQPVNTDFPETLFTNQYRSKRLTWKKALEKDRGLLKHQQSSPHNDAVQRYVNGPVENHDIGEITSSNITQLRRTNTNNLLKIISNIKFLAKKYS